ncbi:MAG: hypothetical protein Q4D53_05285 [Leptotrichiaceae bacterium]|nr:hypothetical protein [Leptotrichiaceae bacterium]
MKKIYKTVLLTHIWLIIQYFIVSVMLSSLSGSLILLIFKVITGKSYTSLIEINTLFIIVGILSVIGGAVYNSGKKIVLEKGILIYYSFFKEKFKLDIIKNKVYLEIKPKRTRRSYYLKRTLYFTENGVKKGINCDWLSARQCNELIVEMEKYKYISSENKDFENGEIFNTEEISEKFFIGGQKMISQQIVSQRIKKVWIRSLIFVFSILAISLIMAFMIFEVFGLYFFLIILGGFIIIIFAPVSIFLFVLKKRIEKYTPEYIIVKSKDISVDNANFSKYDVNRIEMTRKEATLYTLFNERKMIIRSKGEKYMFVLGNHPPHLKEFLFLYPLAIYEDYDLLYDNIMKWCFRNNIEFVQMGY